MPNAKNSLNNEVVHMLYNQYLLMLRELDSYKDKIVYYMTSDTKTPEYKLQTLNLDFNKRIFMLEDAFGEIKKEHDNGKRNMDHRSSS